MALAMCGPAGLWQEMQSRACPSDRSLGGTNAVCQHNRLDQSVEVEGNAVKHQRRNVT
jgi:hypothetical protein